METNYTIAGSDGKTYGPVTLAELQTWIRDGRVGAQTNVLRSDVNNWFPASQYQELSFGGASTPAPVSQGTYGAAHAVAGQFPELEKRIKSGAGWFFWIAGLSIINVIMTLSGSEGGFILGLGVADIAAVVGKGIGGAVGNTIGLVLSLGLCGLFILFGIFANKKHSWAFITGMVLYLLDGLIFLLVQEWGSFGFHLFAAFWIFMGLKANLELKKETGA